MEIFKDSNSAQNILKVSSVFSLFWGLLFIFSPGSFSTAGSIVLPITSAAFVVLTGIVYLLNSLILYIASFDKARHWLAILLVSFIDLAVTCLFLYFTVNSYYDLLPGSLLCLIHLVKYLALLGVLNAAYEENTFEESAPKKFNDLLGIVRTSQNKSLLELSNEKKVLLVFVRHFGCTFCRETVSEFAKIDDMIAEKNYHLVFVHMSDTDFGNQFFSQYYKHPVHHISDPAKLLYRSLNLKRGTFLQLFGPMTWVRGIYAGLFKGNGLGEVEGDSLQLGGLFILDQGKIVFEHRSKSASQQFQLKALPEL